MIRFVLARGSELSATLTYCDAMRCDRVGGGFFLVVFRRRPPRSLIFIAVD